MHYYLASLIAQVNYSNPVDLLELVIKCVERIMIRGKVSLNEVVRVCLFSFKKNKRKRNKTHI